MFFNLRWHEVHIFKEVIEDQLLGARLDNSFMHKLSELGRAHGGIGVEGRLTEALRSVLAACQVRALSAANGFGLGPTPTIPSSSCLRSPKPRSPSLPMAGAVPFPIRTTGSGSEIQCFRGTFCWEMGLARTLPSSVTLSGGGRSRARILLAFAGVASTRLPITLACVCVAEMHPNRTQTAIDRMPVPALQTSLVNIFYYHHSHT